MNLSENCDSANTVFKKCTVCGFEWNSRDEFLNDVNIEFIGYQVNFTNLALGYYNFTKDLFILLCKI